MRIILLTLLSIIGLSATAKQEVKPELIATAITTGGLLPDSTWYYIYDDGSVKENCGGETVGKLKKPFLTDLIAATKATVNSPINETLDCGQEVGRTTVTFYKNATTDSSCSLLTGNAIPVLVEVIDDMTGVCAPKTTFETATKQKPAVAGAYSTLLEITNAIQEYAGFRDLVKFID